MILDSSAVIAVLLAEPGYETLLAKMKSNPSLAIAAPTLVETLIVLRHRADGDPSKEVIGFLRALDAQVISMTEDHCAVAAKADAKYGKGRHLAALNFGDCLSYAAAKVADEPLIFTGNDFGRTDIQVA